MTTNPKTRQPQYHTGRAALEREVVVEPFRSGGPGGQHRNVTDSGVRLHHVPSGVRVAVADSRSQHQNRETGFTRLIGRLQKLNQVRKPRVPTQVSRPGIERRLNEKKQRQTIKRTRAPVSDHDE